MEDLDLIADLNAQDDDGLGWSTLSTPGTLSECSPVRCCSRATDRQRRSLASAREDGQVHFAILLGSVEKNRHLLDRTTA